MSVHPITIVVCDECEGENYGADYDSDENMARLTARGEGWTVLLGDDGQILDLCKYCTENK